MLPVVVYVDYFAAPSDDMAAEAMSRLYDADPSLDTVHTDIGPEMLVALEEFLTGVSYQDNTPDVKDGRILVTLGEDEFVLVSVAVEARDELAGADDRRLVELAVRWAQVEEISGGHNDSNALLGVLEDLRGLAGRARDKGDRLYCWVRF